MKPYLLAVLALSNLTLASCTPLGSHTILYYANGQKAMETDADATGYVCKIKGVGSISALTHMHSTAITAHGQANADTLKAAGDAVGVGAKAFMGLP